MGCKSIGASGHGHKRKSIARFFLFLWGHSVEVRKMQLNMGLLTGTVIKNKIL